MKKNIVIKFILSFIFTLANSGQAAGNNQEECPGVDDITLDANSVSPVGLLGLVEDSTKRFKFKGLNFCLGATTRQNVENFIKNHQTGKNILLVFSIKKYPNDATKPNENFRCAYSAVAVEACLTPQEIKDIRENSLNTWYKYNIDAKKRMDLIEFDMINNKNND
jgi:hypothetical protein